MKCEPGIKHRLARVQGQLNGVSRMIDDDDRSCQDVVTQLLAVRASVDKLIAHITANNLVLSLQEQGTTQLSEQVQDALDLVIRTK